MIQSQWASTGAMTGAIGALASWLCCLPVLFGFGGMAASGLATTLGAYRPWLNGVSLLLLGAAFYQVYVRKTCGENGCSTGKNRLSRIFFWAAVVVVLFSITLHHWSSWLIYWMI